MIEERVAKIKIKVKMFSISRLKIIFIIPIKEVPSKNKPSHNEESSAKNKPFNIQYKDINKHAKENHNG